RKAVSLALLADALPQPSRCPGERNDTRRVRGWAQGPDPRGAGLVAGSDGQLRLLRARRHGRVPAREGLRKRQPRSAPVGRRHLEARTLLAVDEWRRGVPPEGPAERPPQRS